ncbi:MAG: hypothetical protein IJ794_06570 [Lachnospiraceae bacterium]|nr:hypothetical protein [Lachnospiraceae bacterium]
MHAIKFPSQKLWCLCLVLLCATLAACGKTGKLDEGNCECTVSLVELPKEFSMLEENIREHFEVNVTLKNITTEKLYHITLAEKEDFTETVHLHPGTYQVFGAATNQASNAGLTLKADTDSVVLREDTPATLQIRIADTEAFTEHWMSVQPMPEMRLAEKFDALVQINRQVFDLRAENNSALFDTLDLKYDKEVRAYEKIEVSNQEKGITLTLQNQTDSPANWKDCRIIGINVTKNNAVFPQGVTLGMAPFAVCHESDGVYGAPDKLTGSLLLGWQLDHTYAIYNDPVSGDKLTIDLGVNNSQIHGIRYELALFEE